MEEKNLEPKFEITVPFNHEEMVKDRKNSKILSGSLCLVGFAFFTFILIMALLNNNPSTSMIIVFVCIDVAILACALYFFLSTKPDKKNEAKIVIYHFFEDLLQISQNKGTKNAKEKVLESCLYQKNKGKQYVAKVFEFVNKFQLRIFTGTNNGVPQYRAHIVPKAILNSEEDLNRFTEFLKSKLLDDYVVKI